MISGPQYHQNKLKFIQLSKMSENKLLVVTVVEGNLIRNKVVTVQEEISQVHPLDHQLLDLGDLLLLLLHDLVHIADTVLCLVFCYFLKTLLTNKPC